MGLTHPHIDISFSIYFPSLFFHANIFILLSYSELTFMRGENKRVRVRERFQTSRKNLQILQFSNTYQTIKMWQQVKFRTKDYEICNSQERCENRKYFLKKEIFKFSKLILTRKTKFWQGRIAPDTQHCYNINCYTIEIDYCRTKLI